MCIRDRRMKQYDPKWVETWAVKPALSASAVRRRRVTQVSWEIHAMKWPVDLTARCPSTRQSVGWLNGWAEHTRASPSQAETTRAKPNQRRERAGKGVRLEMSPAAFVSLYFAASGNHYNSTSSLFLRTSLRLLSFNEPIFYASAEA